MLKVLKDTIGFYLPFFIFIILGGLYLFFQYENGDWVLWFCANFEQTRFDIFSWFTLLGEPQVLVPIAFLFFVLNYGRGAFVFLSWFSASLITIILKFLIANHRPAHFFKETFIACAGEIPLWFNLSTPSGHTTAAFAFFAGLAILSKNKGVQFALFLIAICTGLSRMVLFMHFFYDVYFGAIIGGCSAFVLIYLLENVSRFKFQEWRNKFLWNPFR